MDRKVYQQLAAAFAAYQNCVQSNNEHWRERWQQQIDEICANCLPHGSGFDAGTTFDYDSSRVNRLVLNTSYHHMTEHGLYDGWTEHDVIVTPDLQHGFMLRVTGRDRNMIKDYIAETFSFDLNEQHRGFEKK